MTNYPEWQKHIRAAQVKRDEDKRRKEIAEKEAALERERRNREIKNEQFGFVLSKLLGFEVTVNDDGKFTAEPYTFALTEVNQLSMRDTATPVLECKFTILREGHGRNFNIGQQVKDAEWELSAKLADTIDDLDRQVESQVAA